MIVFHGEYHKERSDQSDLVMARKALANHVIYPKLVKELLDGLIAHIRHL
jgi:hypothetical protein